MNDTTVMTEPSRRSFPRLKVLYLFAVSAAAFVVPAVEQTRAARWYVVPGLLSLQVVLLLAARVHPREILWASVRLRWLFLFLVACYVFLPGNPDAGDVIYDWQPPVKVWPIPLNLTGLETACLMSLQIVTVILVSAVVRLTGSSTDLVDGLRGFGLPRLFVHSIDTTLALLGGVERRGMGRGGRGGRGRGGGGGGGRGMGGAKGGNRNAEGESVKQPVLTAPHESEPATCPGETAPDPSKKPMSALRSLLRGDVGFFVRSIEQSLAEARERVGREGGAGLDERLLHDVSVISGIALAMMSLKMLKVLPSVPFMPGWKTMFFYPLYILAAHLTYSRWGATTAGAIMGVLGYLQGDGKYGAMEILKHLVPGITIDLAWPLVRRLPRSAFVFCVLGFVTAIARTSTEFLTMLLVQARLEAYAIVLMTLASNLLAGTLSGLVTYFVLPAFRRPDARSPEGPAAQPVEGPAPVTSEPAPVSAMQQSPNVADEQAVAYGLEPSGKPAVADSHEENS